MSARPMIPPPKEGDPEDVHWALSTATTLWSRDERAEAVKWLRRAAESASDQDDDVRALELMKAAAEITTMLSNPPPAPSVAPPPVAPPPAAAVPAAPQRAPLPQPAAAK